jgi:dolichyl-phosphate-mannose-protein mannosyltransferase
MRNCSSCTGNPEWLPFALIDCPERTALALIVTLAVSIRLYLCLTSFCIAGDGVAYLAMARDFAAGDSAKALAAVFSPLYPWFVAIAHRLIPDWELAGNAVSAILGSVAVVSVYLMTREVFESRDLALGAAVLVAIHPEMAAYSASVRTEAGFIFFLTTAVWLLIAGLKRARIALVAAAGLVGGLAYLYRTEAFGLLMFGVGFVLVAELWWRQWDLVWTIAATTIFAIGFLTVASPYLIYLRETTGHWSVGREFTAAMMYGMGTVAPDRLAWQRLGYSTSVSSFAPLLASPRLYLEKVGNDFFGSLYGFIQALGPLLSIFLIVGLWRRRRVIFANLGEALLALLTAFYVVGFSFSYTGARFMLHLVPFTFGWVMVGLAAASVRFTRITAGTRFSRLPPYALGIAIAFVLLPQTLWPIGFDMRGVRYAGEEVARRTDGKPNAVAARDGRFAYYAGSAFILLPTESIPDICAWLHAQSGVGYLVLDNHDERRLGVTTPPRCISLVKRYPRYGAAYYDLFEVGRSK